MQRFLTAGLLSLLIPAICMASHGQAVVGDAIDGDGNGVFSGSYVQSTTDHPWYTLCANVGDTLQIDLTTTFGAGANNQGSFLWLYRVLDDMAEVGDTPGVDISNVASSSNNDTDDLLDQSITYVVTEAGQYIIQVDSWLGGSGDFELTVRGATGVCNNPVPEPASLAIFGLMTLAGAGRLRRRNRQES